MSNNQVTLGGEWLDKEPAKSFNEAFEIRTRKFLSSHLVRDDYAGYIVPDYDQLLIGLMEFIQNEQKIYNQR